jgi:uncharacterized protein (DUF2267 family)
MSDADPGGDLEMARRAMVQRLAGGDALAETLGHEVLNPLNCALLQLAVLQRRLEEPDCRPLALRGVAEAVERALRRLVVMFNDFVALPPYRGATGSSARDQVSLETDIFDVVTAETRDWMRAVMAEGAGDVETSLAMMGAGLRAVRDRLTVEEAAQLSGRLPVLLRGMLFEAWDPDARGLGTSAEVLAMLERRCPAAEGAAPTAASSVMLRVLRRQLEGGPAEPPAPPIPSSPPTGPPLRR